MNEHDHHPGEDPERITPPAASDDLESRLFAVSQAQLRRLPELDTNTPVCVTRATTEQDTDEAQGERFWFGVFAAYLDLGIALPDGIDPVADCEQRYVGTWPDRSSFVRECLQERGLDKALAELQVEWGIWPGDLAWDQTVLWEHFANTYRISEQNGSIHAFRG